MITPLQRFRYLSLVIALAFVFAAYKGCEMLPESTFQLSSDSRLPKWITLPPGLTRADVSLTMNYYVLPWGRDAQFVLRDKNEHALKKEDGKMRCKEPLQLKNSSQGFPSGYPAYEAITVNGITEIIEHKKMEPIFYVTDDTSVWKQYESNGCG
ncbi:hypothetical protein [Edaphobacter sp.]|uniref:hypothetical protein n=1 Tax=Edaphobacter sp. TaxID=1934404 RepID=UPI002DB79631|nr:hypothetical protein [Edaphobacter sp.]HEU5339805.1 hypothetical protein [Edaphobacter sp.]